MDKNTLSASQASDPIPGFPEQDRSKDQSGKKGMSTPDGGYSSADSESTQLPDELNSDGSASAFEGTEAIPDEDAGRKNKRREADNPSGLSDY